MQGETSLSSSSVSGQYGAVGAGSHLAVLNDTEPQHLHHVNQDLWQRSFQSVITSAHDQSPTPNPSFYLHGHSLTTSNSGSLPQPLQAHVFPSQDPPSHDSSVSPPEPATTGPEFQNSPIQDATPAQVQSPGYVK
ncbi:hypothetical protein LZL87_006121 [Fusarium oxysporum]|nr:hypothetical protein LZL87_006121 [Fusarium oxysporum]